MISGEKGYAKQKYKKFVEAAIGRDPDDTHKEVYGGIILGNTSFIKETLERIKEEILQKEEISHSRILRTGYDIEEIVNFISDFNNPHSRSKCNSGDFVWGFIAQAFSWPVVNT